MQKWPKKSKKSLVSGGASFSLIVVSVESLVTKEKAGMLALAAPINVFFSNLLNIVCYRSIIDLKVYIALFFMPLSSIPFTEPSPLAKKLPAIGYVVPHSDICQKGLSRPGKAYQKFRGPRCYIILPILPNPNQPECAGRKLSGVPPGRYCYPPWKKMAEGTEGVKRNGATSPNFPNTFGHALRACAVSSPWNA